MWKCSACKSDNPDSSPVCQSCGAKASQSTSANGRPSFFMANAGPSVNPNPADARARVRNHLTESQTATTLNRIGNMYLAMTIVIAVLGFFAVGFYLGGLRDSFSILPALIFAIIFTFSGLVPAYLLKAMGSIVQNTENTSNLICFQIEHSAENSRGE